MSQSSGWRCKECGQENAGAYCIRCGSPRAAYAAPLDLGGAGRSGTKACPACGETIQADARKCRFCGEFLVTCPHCKAETAQGFKVCHVCKGALGPGPASKPPTKIPDVGQPPIRTRTAPPVPRPSTAESDLRTKRLIAASRSYVGPAFLTLILYYIGVYIVGLIVNLAYLGSANKIKRETGISPSGRGCLQLLWFTHFLIPAILICVLLLLPAVGVGDYQDILAAADRLGENISDMFDSGEFSWDALVAGIGDDDDRGDSGRRSPSRSEPEVDPWEEAVDEARRTLQNAEDFEANLGSYQAQADRISREIALVEEASPLLRKVDELEATEIPFMGNAWDVVVDLIDAAAPGAGQGLDALVDLLREIERFKRDLDQLQSLEPVVSASRSFRNSATEQNLRGLDRAIGAALPNLAQVDGDVAELEDTVSDVLDSIGVVQEGLSDAAGLTDLPIVRDAVRSLNNSVNDLLRPLRDLQDLLETWHEQMQGDLEVMRSIQRAVERAG